MPAHTTCTCYNKKDGGNIKRNGSLSLLYMLTQEKIHWSRALLKKTNLPFLPLVVRVLHRA